MLFLVYLEKLYSRLGHPSFGTAKIALHEPSINSSNISHKNKDTDPFCKNFQLPKAHRFPFLSSYNRVPCSFDLLYKING